MDYHILIFAPCYGARNSISFLSLLGSRAWAQGHDRFTENSAYSTEIAETTERGCLFVSIIGQNFQDLTQGHTRVRQTLTPQQVNFELHGIESSVNGLRSLDGRVQDTEGAPGVVDVIQDGTSMTFPTRLQGRFADKETAEKLPVTEFTYESQLFFGSPRPQTVLNDFAQLFTQQPSPMFRSVVSGAHDPNTQTWTCTQTVMGPQSITQESLHIDAADPSKSHGFKDTWNLNS